MPASKTTLNSANQLTRFLSPTTIITRFVTRTTIVGALSLALVFAVFVLSKSTGYAIAYPTAQSRAAAAVSLGHNAGLNAILGLPIRINTVAGLTVWNTLGVMAILGAIWGLIVATKIFRGQEESGHWELLLAGQTTERRAAANALMGLGLSWLTLYALTALTFIGIGKINSVNFPVGGALFFALAAASSAAVFMTLGALTSQLMPIRGRATSLGLIIFGIAFLLRAMADTTSAHWLLDLTPLGWIEKLQPLNTIQPLWLLPLVALAAVFGALAVWLAGRRDLGESTFPDVDTAKPRTMLLGTPLGLATRMTFGTNISWLVALSLGGAFFGLLTQSAAQAFAASTRAEHIISRLANNSKQLGAQNFLGIIFFLLMLLVMCYAASAASAIRNDEAEGYVDNLLVGPVSRRQWLIGRVFLALMVIAAAGLLSGVSVRIGMNHHLNGLNFHTLLLAGANIMAPALFVLGVGLASFAAWPRLTNLIAYGIIVWSFLIEIISSGLNLSHWLLDTSIFYHIALAPAANPNWHNNAILIAIGLILVAVSVLQFNRRDLQPE